MAQEIERKFLLCNSDWRNLAEAVHYRQGYLRSSHVPLRIHTLGTPARTSGFVLIVTEMAGTTYEYSIPIGDAIGLLDYLCYNTRQWMEGGILYREGFLSRDAGHTIRFRIAGSKGFLTIKTRVVGLSRMEYEFVIPTADAAALLDGLCEQPQIEKYRYTILYQGMVWEVDEFLGDNQGLFLAEVELDRPDQSIVLPPWIGTEVSGDERYYNSNLVKHPFSQWQ
ncbi:MAG: CYTH domain-containing protein [Synechococcales bacterium]|nr:CYTH domain-containing protein [Synechococcales bacterium]